MWGDGAACQGSVVWGYLGKVVSWDVWYKVNSSGYKIHGREGMVGILRWECGNQVVPGRLNHLWCLRKVFHLIRKELIVLNPLMKSQ